MYRLFSLYVRLIDSLNEMLGNVLKGGIFVIIFVLLFETVSRYVLDEPTNWSVEMAQFVFGTYVILGGGYVLLHGTHIRMDALYSRWSAKRKAITDIATFPFFAIYLVVFILGGVRDASFSLKFGQHSQSMWSPPLAPIKIIIVVGGSILLLELLALLFRSLFALRGKDLR